MIGFDIYFFPKINKIIYMNINPPDTYKLFDVSRKIPFLSPGTSSTNSIFGFYVHQFSDGNTHIRLKKSEGCETRINSFSLR